MNISIIGWYGTETLGDRAILDGIISITNKIDSRTTIRIGSLYPFYTNRTIYEERERFEKSAPGIKLEVFNIKDNCESELAIDNSELVVVGGGPLMDNIDEIFLLLKNFKYAKSKGTPCVILGCGIGPLYNKTYIKAVKKLIFMADIVILRDELSNKMVRKICGNSINCKVIGDPAVISIESSISIKAASNEYLAVNFRDYPKDYYSAVSIIEDKDFVKFIDICSDLFEKILLVPMHTFIVGNDDRLYLSKIKRLVNKDNISVVHQPMNLDALYSCYTNASACVGMRYHSIVMQTILNGNNAILNYTDSQYGKIPGFIKTLNTSFYNTRIKELQDSYGWNESEMIDMLLTLKSGQRFNYIKTNYLENYKSSILSVI